MRKITRYGILSMAVLMLLAGCSQKEGDTVSDAATAADAAEATAGKDAAESVDYGAIELGAYKGLEIERISTEVTEEEIETEIANILAYYPDLVEVVDRPAQLGDTVNIDYVGLKDGVAFEGGTAQGHELKLGSQSFISGFEDGLVGYNKGDEVSLNLTFPEVYQSEELAGQEVVFEVTINSIEEEQEAELNDAFVQRISDLTTVEEFRETVRGMISEYKEEEANNALSQQALQIATENSEYTLNQDAVDKMYKEYYESNENYATMYGMTLEEMLAAQQVTLEEFEEIIKNGAEEYVRQQLVVSAIARAESLVVEDADRQAAAESNNTELEALVGYYGEEEFDHMILTDKVVKFLLDNAAIK